MPTFPVRRTTRLLRNYLRHFKWTAIAAIVATLGIGMAAFLTGASLVNVGLLAVGLLALASRYGYLAYRAWQADRQLQLEARFMRQPLNQTPLSVCLQSRQPHLWDGSYTFRALQRALKLPLPQLMLVEQKLERLIRFFRLAYLPLQMRFWKANLFSGSVVAASAFAFLARSPSAELLNASWLGLLCLSGFELILWRQRSRIRRQLDVFLKGLSRWTLSERQNGTLRDDLRKPYQHTLLYHSPRWFDSSQENTPEQQRAA